MLPGSLHGLHSAVLEVELGAGGEQGQVFGQVTGLDGLGRGQGNELGFRGLDQFGVDPLHIGVRGRGWHQFPGGGTDPGLSRRRAAFHRGPLNCERHPIQCRHIAAGGDVGPRRPVAGLALLLTQPGFGVQLLTPGIDHCRGRVGFLMLGLTGVQSDPLAHRPNRRIRGRFTPHSGFQGHDLRQLRVDFLRPRRQRRDPLRTNPSDLSGAATNIDRFPFPPQLFTGQRPEHRMRLRRRCSGLPIQGTGIDPAPFAVHTTNSRGTDHVRVQLRLTVAVRRLDVGLRQQPFGLNPILRRRCGTPVHVQAVLGNIGQTSLRRFQHQGLDLLADLTRGVRPNR